MIQVVDLRSRLNVAEVRELVDQLGYPIENQREKTTQILNEYREHVEQPILGAESGCKLVGLVGLSLQPPDGAIIRHIVVRRDHRGQGIGSQMIDQLFRIYGVRVVFAETDRDAVEFYRKVGFAVKSLGEKYPGTERFACSLERSPQQSAAGYADRAVT